MINFENTVKRRFKINDFNVDKDANIYINDILFEPLEKKYISAGEIYNMFFAGAEIWVDYYCPTDGKNFPKRFSIRYIENLNFVEVTRI